MKPNSQLELSNLLQVDETSVPVHQYLSLAFVQPTGRDAGRKKIPRGRIPPPLPLPLAEAVEEHRLDDQLQTQALGLIRTASIRPWIVFDHGFRYPPVRVSVLVNRAS